MVVFQLVLCLTFFGMTHCCVPHHNTRGPVVPYSMYVWATGWDPDVGCSQEEFMEWDERSRCFTPVFNTLERRKWLWDTCNRQGREIDTLFLYTNSFILQSRNCQSPETLLLKTTIKEGHTEVSDLKIYALFSLGGSDIPEKDHIVDVVWYNKECAADESERFDGVSVNHEDYDKSWSKSQMVTFLNNLNQIRVEADKQEPVGSLKTHFSVGWHWGLNIDHTQPIIITWNQKTQNIMHHFIDIFHTLDVQTAYVLTSQMKDRMKTAGYDYARETSKVIYNTVYLSKTSPCQITFFDFPAKSNCPPWSHNYEGEDAMFAQTDVLIAHMPGVRVCLHYFRGAYSSGGHQDWPKHG